MHRSITCQPMFGVVHYSMPMASCLMSTQINRPLWPHAPYWSKSMHEPDMSQTVSGNDVYWRSLLVGVFVRQSVWFEIINFCPPNKISTLCLAFNFCFSISWVWSIAVDDLPLANHDLRWHWEWEHQYIESECFDLSTSERLVLLALSHRSICHPLVKVDLYTVCRLFSLFGIQ